MHDLIANLWLGVGVAVTPTNIGLVLIGSIVGTLIGVLPGIGSLATIAMLLPITFGLPPVGALIMLAGIYYGAQYGGSTTSILVNIPGEASSVVTTLDGHQMARQGRGVPRAARPSHPGPKAHSRARDRPGSAVPAAPGESARCRGTRNGGRRLPTEPGRCRQTPTASGRRRR